MVVECFTTAIQPIRLETMKLCAETNDETSQFNQLKISFVTGNEMKVRLCAPSCCSSKIKNELNLNQPSFVDTLLWKAREMNMILSDHGATKGPNPKISLVDLKVLNVDLPEIQEVSTEAIAKNKAIQAAQLANGPCVVEDTSLQFEALGGMPGPYIKWFQQQLQSEGLYNLLLAYEDKTAVAVCTLAFCPFPHADPVLFTGRTRGTIVQPVEGRGFGWDSIFVPDGSDRPFSMMSTEDKNALSHRGQAVRQWADWLGDNHQELWERQNGKSAVGHKGLNFKGTYAEE